MKTQNLSRNLVSTSERHKNDTPEFAGRRYNRRAVGAWTQEPGRRACMTRSPSSFLCELWRVISWSVPQSPYLWNLEYLPHRIIRNMRQQSDPYNSILVLSIQWVGLRGRHFSLKLGRIGVKTKLGKEIHVAPCEQRRPKGARVDGWQQLK